METKKVTVKLATEETVKRVPKAETYDKLVEAAKVFSKSKSVKLTYKDEEEDIIVISDDDDLASAYDWASNAPGLTLKIHVESIETPIAKAVESSEEESSSDDEDKMKEAVRRMASQSVASIVEDHISTAQSESNAYPSLDEIDKEDVQIDTCVTKITNPEPVIRDVQIDTGSKKTEEPAVDKQENVDEFPVVHENVECDGCGICPIIGPRYKCSVRKDFDFCANCEALKPQEYAMLKINKPEQCPKAIFTVIGEDMPNQEAVQADMEAQINEQQHKEWSEKKAWGRINPQNAEKPLETFDVQAGMNPQAMKKKIGWFMKNLFGKQQMCGPAQKAFCEAKQEGRKNPRRAVIVQQPGSVLAAWAGDVMEVEFTFKNATKWPYPKGFHLESCYTDETKLLLDNVKIPVPEVKPGETFTVKTSIKVLDNVLPCKECYRDYIVAEFGITNTHGDHVGMKATTKIQVVQKIDELSLYDKVMQLMGEAQTLVENSTGEPFSFDKAVNALKMASYDVKKAQQIISQDLQKSGIVVRQEDLEVEEDLYN